MSSKLDLTKLDLYGILNVSIEATEKEIVKSYRKQALKCHPDKNPDNPKAAEEFHKITQALEVLTDAAARAAYDKILKAKKAVEIRHKQYDARRKKFKDDLDARESAAQQQKEKELDAAEKLQAEDKSGNTRESAAQQLKEKELDAAEKLQAEIERLRKEGNRILEEAQEQLKEDLKKKTDLNRVYIDSDSDDEEELTAKLKVRWKLKKKDETAEGYSKEELQDIFSKYGEVLNIVISTNDVKKSGTAIVEFASPYAADSAVQSETGRSSVPLTLSWLQGQPPKERQGEGQRLSSQEGRGDYGGAGLFPSAGISSGPSAMGFSSSLSSDNKDFESIVLMRMRQAEERKRLIEQMEKEDGEKT